jgi:hypothetical protein
LAIDPKERSSQEPNPRCVLDSRSKKARDATGKRLPFGAALALPPLDEDTIIAGHRGLDFARR